MIDSRRIFRAFRCRVALKVEVRGARRLSSARTRDLSVGGLCLSGMNRPDGDERLGLTLAGPHGQPLSIPAEVRWSRREESGRYAVGAEFVHSFETQRSIERLAWELESGRRHHNDPPPSRYDPPPPD